MDEPRAHEYAYPDATPRWNDGFLWSAAERLVRRHAAPGATIFELGCGSGATAARLHALGYRVTAVDPSASGIAAARAAHPDVEFHCAAAAEVSGERFGRYPLLLSLEVVEHCYSPASFAAACFDVLEPGGVAIVSTPYHGYLKNLALALTDRMDAHFSPLWEGGHIKFFSRATLTQLLERAGFELLATARVGRIPPLAKSLIAVARRPATAR